MWEEGPSLDAVLDGVQLAVDVAGLIPVFGDAADLLNAGISLARGNYEDAALSLAALVPVLGGAATAAKWGRKLHKAVEGVVSHAIHGGLGSKLHKPLAGLANAVGFNACFVAGTPIRTEFGSKPIEALRDYETFGDDCDWVLARDEFHDDGPVRPRQSDARLPPESRPGGFQPMDRRFWSSSRRGLVQAAIGEQGCVPAWRFLNEHGGQARGAI